VAVVVLLCREQKHAELVSTAAEIDPLAAGGFPSIGGQFLRTADSSERSRRPGIGWVDLGRRTSLSRSRACPEERACWRSDVPPAGDASTRSEGRVR
jgi:hypothetical protein